MTESPSNPLDIEAMLTSLRQKRGSWVEWGQAIAQLQKAGQTPQQIFEATGFEPVQQNQVIVGAQVYTSLEKTNASEAVRSRFTQKGSDILYELRLLNNAERVAAAEFILAHNLDADMAKEVARDMKEFSRLRNLPEGFANHPGDAIAYQCWRLARQKSDLQERSRLIAKGLRFADSDTARQKIEQLLVDFTVVPKRPAPTIPFYRPDSEDQLPRLIPVVGEMPLQSAEVQAVPIVEAVEPFRIVKFAGEQAWVALPGWQTIRSAEDPIAILCQSDRLPNQSATASEPVLVVADRDAREWDVNSYFVCDAAGEVDFAWFETQPDVKLLGKIVVVVRPKHIIDEELTKDSWQIDE